MLVMGGGGKMKTVRYDLIGIRELLGFWLGSGQRALKPLSNKDFSKTLIMLGSKNLIFSFKYYINTKP